VPEQVFWFGVNEFVAKLSEFTTAAAAGSRAAVAEAASTLETKAKQNATGRPGPNVVTGTLRRSITHDPITAFGLGGAQTNVGPTVIYGRRIELGFTGADSRGRHYNQPPYPYFVPAFESTDFAGIYAKHWAEALSG